jgi:glycosyltransferase involved in cell wall biosynthesis
VTRVHQVTGAAGRHDAVTGQLLAYQELLREWGLAGGMHAVISTADAPAEIRPVAELDPDGDDLVLIHYSGWIAGMGPLLELPQRKALVYHNITPARYFWSVHPVVAVVCEVGRDKLPALVAASNATAGVSAYNAEELRAAGAPDPRVVPILADPARLARSATPEEGGPLVLAVGRLAPHKRPDLVIRAFALYQRLHAPDARLLYAGAPQHPPYGARLEQLVEEVGVRDVRLAGTLDDDALGRAYAEARVMLSLSEHEGFCIPLLEAFHAEVPVIARRSAAMPEVGGDAVLWVDHDDDIAVVAELLHLAVTDDELRAELTRRGRRRAQEFAPERVAEAVRGLVDAALA